MKTVLLFSFTYFHCLGLILSQNWTAPPITDWHKAGVSDTIPDYSSVVNIMDFGADDSGELSSNDAFLEALAALDGQPGVILFPEGQFFFDRRILLRDSVIMRGEGADKTELTFDLDGQISDAIQIRGQSVNDLIVIEGDIAQNTTELIVNTDFSGDDLLSQKWFYLVFDDTELMASSWAYGLGGTLVSVKGFSEDTLYLDQPIRLAISDSLQPFLRPVNPVKGCGIECLKVRRSDPTEFQTSNILFRFAHDCWVIGVESEFCNFGHVDIRQSSGITVRGCYFHDAHAFGGGGQAYGVILQSSASSCLVENNAFRLLRHSILLQSGANGNVIGYNYSTEPFWTGVSLPANSAGDLVCHGNYPYFNLFEGNIVQNIVVDASHGKNGPHNIFHRNRAELYGIFMSPGSGTDSTHFIGNEVTNTGFLLGNYSLIGAGNIEYGNRVRGQVRPAGTDSLPLLSLYLTEAPGFWQSATWPHIGIDNPDLSALNPAFQRFEQQIYTDCERNPRHDPMVGISQPELAGISVFPNPVSEQFYIHLDKTRDLDVKIYDLHGRLIGLEKRHGQSEYSYALPVVHSPVLILHITDNLTKESCVKRLLVNYD